VDNPGATENSLSSLEFPAILDRLALHCRSVYGREAATLLRPSSSRADVQSLQDETREMVLFRQTSGFLPLSLPTDIRPLLARLEVEGSLLAAPEILLVVEAMRTGQEVRALLARSEHPRLRESGRSFPDLGNLLRYLDGKISATGDLEDRCSPELTQVRRRITAISARLEEALRSIASKPEMARALQDDFVALRNNRRVLPVRIDSQSLVEGIVHALSSSGATVYMEPLSTVPLNNDLVRMKEEEEVEQRRILLDFTGLLRTRAGDLRLLTALLGEADLLAAKAALAEEMQAVDPDLTEGAPGADASRMALVQARHPVLERSLEGSGRRLVPLDLTLPATHRVLVISGPNTGGKTVALKTVGLLALMSQSGLKVPASAARLPVFRRILIDIGDHQSIPDSLSTFSARMGHISEMARQIEDPSLVLLDEVGTGTDPEEGACLGAAVIDYFRRHGAVVLATTHHQTLKAFAAATPGTANASMEFDESSLSPLFRLRPGVPGRSGGLDIAERLGVPVEIVREARSLLPRHREMLEEYLARLQALQKDLDTRIHEARDEALAAARREEDRQEAARRLSLDREARFAQLLEEVSTQLRKRWEAYLQALSDLEEERRLRREIERQERLMLEEARRALPPDLLPPPARERPLPATPKAGDAVRIASLRIEGILDRLEGDRAIVRSGGKRLSVAVADLEPPQAPSPPDRPLPRGVSLSRPAPSAPSPEINLVGKRVEEALQLLDKYLDELALAGLSPARIVHGVGSGRLRAALRSFLKTHPQVEGFSEAEEREGGRGATVVRIRI
jgi:DNA mismatch repair protein MutS2